MNILIPIICSILFWLGGRDQIPVPFNQKLFRWFGIGLFVGLVGAFYAHSFIPLFSIITYFIATNVMGYGEKHLLRKWFGKDIQWILYGLVFGLSSYPLLGLLSLIQSIVSAISTWTLLKWSNDGFYNKKLNQNWVEIGIGLTGTICYLWLK